MGARMSAGLLADAVYGLTEHYRAQIASARLVACPGCYPTAALTLLLPLVQAGLIETEDLIIDAKSGVTGAGRSLEAKSVQRGGRGRTLTVSGRTGMRLRLNKKCRWPQAGRS